MTFGRKNYRPIHFHRGAILLGLALLLFYPYEAQGMSVQV
jgi:hypothetical protein